MCPYRYLDNGVLDLDPADLKAKGVEAVLLDLDNTLVGWQRSDVSKEVVAWLESLKSHGLKLCLVSNTRHGQRLVALSKELDLPYVRRAWKPSKQGFLNAMQELQVEPSKTIMVGDQMFTDVLGGNRVGIVPMMVKPMHRKEFFGTKISRAAEKVLLVFFRGQGKF